MPERNCALHGRNHNRGQGQWRRYKWQFLLQELCSRIEKAIDRIGCITIAKPYSATMPSLMENKKWLRKHLPITLKHHDKILGG